MKVKVSEGWQLEGADGKLGYAGDTIDVDDAVGEAYVASGQAEEVGAKARTAKNKATEAPEEDNK